MVEKKNWADYAIHAILIAVSILMLLPMYNVVLISFSDPGAIAKQAVYLFPTSLDFSSYRFIFSGDTILSALGVSFIVTFFGTILNIAVTIFGGYALTKKHLPGRKIVLIGILITMLFHGGLIPVYLTVKGLGLINSVLSMILPLAVNTFYLIIMMTYFRTVPEALEESARMDGANDIQILMRIVLPISMPTIAAITLFYAVDRWNEWWSALLYITDTSKYPMQLYLREMLVDVNKMLNNSYAASLASETRDMYPEGLKMAAVVVTMLPVMCIYPLLQRFFSAGVMIGSLKE
ncbi:carbohydrate ABC transporter permease [Paenibacillus sp. LHD-117]|uniref:carbohydrate ABC transporter permease n=1 Tax=Paenibacillus sp. LHD-117 TaxID=3071412 RepID=UPI0027E13779|nr:carbohydrate ABC transporter permease [Paenibacillus sp. LHD-117]MDQ6419550.1 carbohydrate ABC transporter permease [Paenibacillus sp. LHD-117]